MPTYRNPRTGEEVTQPSDGLEAFYLSRGWAEVGGYVDPLTAPGEDGDGNMPANLAGLIADISKPEKKGKAE